MAPAPVPTKANPLFHFHANAHAFSAHFTRPFEHQIDSLAASALPVTGGHGCARVDNFQFQQFISIKAVGSSRVDLQACKLEYSIVSPK